MMSSDDPFDLLELDRNTATLADIKAAYARKLKQTRPDEDPGGFMALRTALEQARNMVFWRDDHRFAYDEPEDEPDTHEPGPDDTGVKVHTVPAETRIEPEGHSEIPADTAPSSDLQPETEWQADSIQSAEDLDVLAVDAVMKEIEDLLTSSDAGNWSSWLTHLETEALESLEAFQMLSYRLRALVCEKTEFDPQSTNAIPKGGLTAEIILRLDERFGWSKQANMNWYENQLNTWIRRLTEEAEFRTGHKKPGAWGRPPERRIDVIGADGKADPGVDASGKSRPSRFIWMAIRIAVIFGLIRVIGQMLLSGGE